MLCTKCIGGRLERLYNVELRSYESRCINCGHYPDQVVVARHCRFVACKIIPTHGEVCSHHASIIVKKRMMLVQAAAHARSHKKKKEVAPCE